MLELVARDFELSARTGEQIITSSVTTTSTPQNSDFRQWCQYGSIVKMLIITVTMFQTKYVDDFDDVSD